MGVSYGAPLNEAALAGSVDVIFTADQPAAALLSRGAKWVIVGRLMFNRVALYVPPSSPIKTVADLANKTIAMPFGAAAQRVALKAIEQAGINPIKGVNSINLDITEQASVIQSGTRESWGKIDAMAGFDPTPANFETKGQARMIHVGRVTSVIVMSKDYIDKYPGAAIHFLKAFKEAVLYYATYADKCNEWFRRDSQITFSNEVLALAASVEPNSKAKTITDVNISLTPDLIKGIQEAADFIFKTGLVKNAVNMLEHINLSYLEQANKELELKRYEPSSVKSRE